MKPNKCIHKTLQEYANNRVYSAAPETKAAAQARICINYAGYGTKSFWNMCVLQTKLTNILEHDIDQILPKISHEEPQRHGTN